ncbi:MAG: 2Fe-2S iron-sulfur cluster binding domain-containing protein [Chitinivibrionales bacterium]|nr:2Fe-2S iron-sulfur cluster binding domain-containing protein [Chitinivibrionales bacterium]MBD3356570.1 2Fe-2S iron-sulfur cluster binding domain-containing protein [Chitinivibrionales bacterium]
MSPIAVKINNIPVKVEPGATILQAAEKVQVKIPTLCYHKDLIPWAACGMCVVKVAGSPKMLRACATPAEEGMSIITHDPEIVNVRRTVLELILSTHPNDCLQCARNGNCELQRLAAEFGIREMRYERRLRDLPQDCSTPSIVLNPEKCIMCGRCAIVCQQMQDVWALEFLGRGEGTRIAPAADVQLNDSPCIKCGQCSAHCPVGAIYEKSETQKVWDRLQEDDTYAVVQIAPAVRVALGEAFGYEPGTLLTGQIYSALRRLGFKAVFDTNFGADLTIMEEGSEFVQRFTESPENLPLITTCCPSWVDYLEKYFPDLIPSFSTAKSPHAMVGALAKTYYAEKMGVDPAKLFMVSIMPCTAKKYEIERCDDMFSSGHQDVDVSLTTRELARMIKSTGVDFANLPKEDADSVLGEYSGAGTIFGATGGVMEAALRTAHFLVTKQELDDASFTETRGLDGIKEGTVNFAGSEVRIAVAHGIANVETILNKVRAAKEKGEEPPYHFIEVMACRGGCVGGGGQPYFVNDEVRRKRAEGLYKDDLSAEKRCSHQNPHILRLYTEFLGEPLSKKSHELLHTHYQARPIYLR